MALNSIDERALPLGGARATSPARSWFLRSITDAKTILAAWALGGPPPGRGRSGAVVTLDSFDLPRCEFLKVDVEGMELPRAQRRRGNDPTAAGRILYVENDREDLSPALIEFLFSLGYQLYWHLPPLFNPQQLLSKPGQRVWAARCRSTCSASIRRSRRTSRA